MGVAFLLALQLPRIHEFRSTRRYVDHDVLEVPPLTFRTAFNYLVSASVTFGGITWGRLLFGFILVSVLILSQCASFIPIFVL